MTDSERLVTGIYGGSFNPIHEGHLSLAKALAESGLVDEMWLLVSPQNPFKVNADLLDDEERLRLARLAVADVQGVEVCDREFSLPRPSYMYNTLRALSKEHPLSPARLYARESALQSDHSQYASARHQQHRDS